MKYLLSLLIVLSLSYSGFTQLESFEKSEPPVPLKNKIGVQINTNLGYLLTFERQLLQKGKFSLLGELGIGTSSFDDEEFFKISSINILLSLQAKYTLGAHSIKAGVGVNYNRVFNNYKYLFWHTSTYGSQNLFSPFLTAGYEFAPVNKKWSIGAGYQYIPKAQQWRSTIYLSTGFKF